MFQAFDYTALGHLHGCQKVTDKAWYSGSPLPYSFSEATHENGMLAVALTRGQPPVVTRVPLCPPHPMRRLRGSLQSLLQDPKVEAATGCLVEITLNKEDAGANPFAVLKDRFPLLLHLSYESEALDAAAPAPGGANPEQPGDILSDYRQFAASIELAPDGTQAGWPWPRPSCEPSPPRKSCETHPPDPSELRPLRR